jgi:hypothetical protein
MLFTVQQIIVKEYVKMSESKMFKEMCWHTSWYHELKHYYSESYNFIYQDLYPAHFNIMNENEKIEGTQADTVRS